MKLGRPTGRDAIAGLVTGLFSIPEGMAYANIGGFNPVLGLYSGMVPTLVGSLTARTVLMVTTLTSAIALSAQSVLAEAGLDPHNLGNVAMLTVMAGVVMLLFGFLKLGALMSFVSNAVMTGFTTGIAVQIIVGAFGDATGYEPAGHNKLRQIADWITHIASWKPVTVGVCLATIAVWAAAWALRPLRPIATLVALVVVTVVVAVADLKVELVGDIAKVTSGLPLPQLPGLAAAPALGLGAFAVALVALAQAAGIGAAVPNPDGSRTDVDADFKAQGYANVLGGLFQALPTGGSLSRTGIATSAGARTRWAGIFAGLWLAVIVLAAGSVTELIPMPVIGGLVIVIGVELVVHRLGDIKLVAATSWAPLTSMIATFLATTQLPLQHAILIGSFLSLALFCGQIAKNARLVRLTRSPRSGRWTASEPPEQLEPGQTLVLRYTGVSFFAELNRINQSWPRIDHADGSILVLLLQTLPDVPSSTLMKAFQKHATKMRDVGGTLILAGVQPSLRKVLDKTGTTEIIGADNIIPAGADSSDALDEALARAGRLRSP
ncbi:SulP family inorganic anion transporter [Nonomuraea sp. NPDC059007]|uniref:SulP family inorganic anion transporter n=1 Tax=Nonomuraea sp. NPDC059007 TaxID=3346692 RepID=UPI00367492AA